MQKIYYTYILANKKRGILYTGVTRSLLKRVYEHKNKLVDGFTKKYNIDILVYYESYQDIRDAISREKAIKKWNRDWKIDLIEKNNFNWNDLYYELNPIE